MIDIHPEIRAFWEKKGKIDTDDVLGTVPSRQYWVVVYHRTDPGDGLVKYKYIASCLSNEDRITYYFNGEEYDEATLLRILKLRAFL